MDGVTTLSGPTMGTRFTVRAVVGTRDAIGLTAELQAAVDRVDAQMSTWVPHSAVSRFNAAPPDTPVELPAELTTVIDLGLQIGAETDGAFDMTLGQLVDLWGFGPPGRVTAPPSDARIADALAACGHRHFTRRGTTLAKSTPLALDLSGIAKGFGVDELARVLLANRVSDFVAEIDGELRVSGNRPDGAAWRIAVALPAPGILAAYQTIAPGTSAIATSGDYRRFFTHGPHHYSHSIDPRTGRPTQSDLASVTVLDPSCARADALATALLVMGSAEATRWAAAHPVSALLLRRNASEIEPIVLGDFGAPVVS